MIRRSHPVVAVVAIPVVAVVAIPVVVVADTATV